MTPDQKMFLASRNDVRSTSVAISIAESAVKADSKLPASIQIVLITSLLNGLFESLNLPFRITLVTTPQQKSELEDSGLAPTLPSVGTGPKPICSGS